MTYQQRIAAIVPNANARHVEAWMRSQYGVLDAMSLAHFEREVRLSADIAHEQPELSEQLAGSLGL